MIPVSVIRMATRLRSRYAEQFAALPHVRFPYFRTDGSHAPRALGYPLADALRDARVTYAAESEGLHCRIEPDDLAWDGDCPAPRHVLYMSVSDPDDPRDILASLGGVGVDSLDDPYLESEAANLYAEALATLRERRDARATEAANVLASRATYAGPSPEVQ